MDDDGRDQAVSRLHSSYRSPLTRLAKLLVRDDPTANRVVDECFIALHDRWHELPADDRSLPYLKQAMVSRCRDVLRDRSRPDG
jgi:DNA-directed RNA polymerase specialized sigma24 family protein